MNSPSKLAATEYQGLSGSGCCGGCATGGWCGCGVLWMWGGWLLAGVFASDASAGLLASSFCHRCMRELASSVSLSPPYCSSTPLSPSGGAGSSLGQLVSVSERTPIVLLLLRAPCCCAGRSLRVGGRCSSCCCWLCLGGTALAGLGL